MNGTVIRIFAGGSAHPSAFSGGIIKADGEFFNCYDPNWINAPAPRDGQYFFQGQGPFSVGQRVTFTPQPGYDYAPGFETASIAVNVQAA